MNQPIESRPRLLLVDDEAANITILAETLGADYAISAAKNGEVAIQLASGDAKPDLILMDVVMPGPSGFSVCSQLKSQPETADIPIIFVTSMSEDVDEEMGLKLGAVDYIHKPIIPAIVKARVALHLRMQLQTEFLKKLLEQQQRRPEPEAAEIRKLLALD